MRRNLIGLAVVAALAAGVVLAQTAEAGLGKGRPGLGANLRQRVIKALNLTADQKAQAKAIFQAAKTAGAPLRTQLQGIRQQMAAAIKKNDTASIQSLAGQAGTLQGELMANRADAMAKFYLILTPDQKTKLDQMQGKIEQLMQQLRGGGQAGL